jgi:probable selenium-dependent hydroxylase accessory protein YqeC
MTKFVVAFVGAGGKSTTMFRLAAARAAAGQQVVTTTSTRIGRDQLKLAPAHLIIDQVAALPDLLAACRHVLVTAPLIPGKALGIGEADIAALAARPEVDLVLVEADGAAGRWLKAPADHEPAIPTCATHVVWIANLRVLGQPLDASHVHRPERASALLGIPLGTPIERTHIDALAQHPLGGRKNVRPHQRLLVYLTGQDREHDLWLALKA